MSANEDWYDHEIAPKLKELAVQCSERQIPFIAVVEYGPGDRGRTQSNLSQASLEMRMLALCSQAGLNIDGYFIGLARYCREKGIDTSASIVMRKLTEPHA